LARAGLWLFLLGVFVLPHAGGPANPDAAFLLFHALHVTVWVYVISRFGLLVTAGGLFATPQLMLAPPPISFPAVYALPGPALAGKVIALAGFGFVVATRGQRLLREGFFGDE